MISPPALSPAQLRRSLRIITLLYFLMYAGTGIYFTYIAVYLQSAQMSGTQIGFFNMTGGVVAFFASTLWGYLSDRTGKPRLLLSIATAGAALSMLLFPLAQTFVHFLLLGSVYFFFNVAISTLMDSNLLTILGDNRADYGKYRLGGTFGFILTTLTVGFLFRSTHLSLMFPLYSAMLLAFSACALFLPDVPINRAGANRSPRAIFSMMRNPSWLVFTLTVFLIWTASSGAGGFLGVTLRNMGADDVLIGVVAASAAIFEIPFMAYNGVLLRKFGSRRLIFYSLLGYVARISIYSLMPSPAWGIAANAFNGVSYVWMWNASINYAYTEAPDNLKATAQGLFVSTTALAGVVSAPLAGLLFDTLGPPGMYRILVGVAVCAAVIFGAGSHALQRAQPKSNPIPEEG